MGTAPMPFPGVFTPKRKANDVALWGKRGVMAFLGDRMASIRLLFIMESRQFHQKSS
jgi:hypothetical protein